FAAIVCLHLEASPQDSRARLAYRGVISDLGNKTVGRGLQAFQELTDASKEVGKSPNALQCQNSIESVALSAKGDVWLTRSVARETFGGSKDELKTAMERELPPALSSGGLGDVTVSDYVAPTGVSRDFTGYLTHLSDQTGGSLLTTLSNFAAAAKDLHRNY